MSVEVFKYSFQTWKHRLLDGSILSTDDDDDRFDSYVILCFFKGLYSFFVVSLTLFRCEEQIQNFVKEE